MTATTAPRRTTETPRRERRPAAEEDRAVRTLLNALDGWWQAQDSFRASIGTSRELCEWAYLCAARDELAARDRWLRWVRQDRDVLVIPGATPIRAWEDGAL